MPPSLAERLREAIAEQGISQRQLARLIAGEDADDRRVENERRQLGKYLAGKHAPSEAKARLIARLLNKPETYFIDEKLVARRLPELVGEVYELVADISSMLDEKIGDAATAKGPPWAMTLHDRLEELAASVQTLLDGQIQTLNELGELRAAIEALPVSGQAPPTQRRAAP